jgi:hypothetical protein
VAFWVLFTSQGCVPRTPCVNMSLWWCPGRAQAVGDTCEEYSWPACPLPCMILFLVVSSQVTRSGIHLCCAMLSRNRFRPGAQCPDIGSNEGEHLVCWPGSLELESLLRGHQVVVLWGPLGLQALVVPTCICSVLVLLKGVLVPEWQAGD